MSNPIKQVANMIAEKFMTAMLDFGSPVCTGQYLWTPGLSAAAERIVEPALKVIDKHVRDVCKVHSL